MSLIDPSARYWMTESTRVAARDDLVSDIERSVCRPVVVIDPEDREQVRSLRKALMSQPVAGLGEDVIGPIQAALRSLIAPPEPKGLGAVVEAIYGNHFVRIGDGHEPWQRVGSGGSRCAWHAIAAVKVLSEGVTA